MALQKAIEKDNTGVFVEYWRVIQTTRHYDRKEITIDLAGYATQEDRDNGKNPIHSKQITLPISELPETRPDIYNIVTKSRMVTNENGEQVETSEFVDAEDC